MPSAIDQYMVIDTLYPQHYGGEIVPPKSQSWPYQQLSVKEAKKQLKAAEKCEKEARKVQKERAKLEAKRARARDVALRTLHSVAGHGVDDAARIAAASKLLSYGNGLN